jgi:hypothetical protein
LVPKKKKKKEKERKSEENKKSLTPTPCTHQSINQSTANLCNTSTAYNLQERLSHPNYYCDIAEFNRVAGGKVLG